MNTEHTHYCLQVSHWARWAPMTWIWLLCGRIPSWACRVCPCVNGWRQFVPRRWTRLLPRSVRWEIAARLPRFLTQKDISPDCVTCQRFLNSIQQPSAVAREISPETVPTVAQAASQATQLEAHCGG